jgi:acyl transferase domain-containing protein/SAM-dependent methyltransferase
MSERDPNAELSPIKRALIEVRQLRERVADLESRASEPLAIVGMSVRAPGGVVDVPGFADLLWSGTDAISDIPADRWPTAEWFDEAQETPGRMYVRHGGFIGDVSGFDAEFFGIAPAEAASLDPQQRLTLELAWEALEDAGHAPTSLAGTRAAVYLGISNSDYGRTLFSRPDLIDPYFSSGNAYSVAAGRVAYVLGFAGPAVAVDTACSSSLVALHLAAQGLRNGDCELALVGGVNLILSPEVNVNFCKAGMLSRDGRCRTFDASADGYARGEGGGMVVLRRLRDALADGDRVLAIVRGTAINQDGRSNGLTAPNGPAQQAVIRTALEAAGVSPHTIGYVEAHGTGTSLGDPIELGALAAVLAEGRSAQTPVAVGSVKTNIGHLEAAAGIVGVIKTVIALGRQEIPPHLHLRTPNPLIDWTAPLAVPTTVMPWPTIDGRRLAGVSSFGFSGTNAHIVLESGPEAPRRTNPVAREQQILALSARSHPALRAVAARFVDTLSSGASNSDWLRDVCATANGGRTHFAHRVSVTAVSADTMAASLREWLDGTETPAVVAGAPREGASMPRVAFLFPGQGPQYVGMGRELYQSAPVFRAALDECAAVLEPYIGQPLLPVIFPAAGDASAIDRAELAQPAMFAFEVALARLWMSWGIAPAAVLGHSFGEYAAACVAGVLSLDDAARIVAARARFTSAAPGHGAMVVVEASADEVETALRGQDAVSIAANNGARNTVISGERTAVERIAAGFVEQGRRATPLRVAHGFHSAMMDPVLDHFDAAIAGIRCHAPATLLVSSLTGTLAGPATLAAPGYWRRHLRETVRFAEATATLAAQGITHFIEISPHPVLLGMAAETIGHAVSVPSLRREHPAWADMLHGVQTLYADGAAIDWRGVEHGQAARRVALPTYPFQRRRHWIDVSHPATASKDAWHSISTTLDQEASRGPLDLHAESYPDKWRAIAKLASAQILATLHELGAFRTAGEQHTVASLLATTGILPVHTRLVTRWLDRLSASGVLRSTGTAYGVADLAAIDPLPAVWQQVDALFEDNRELLAYIRNCTARMTEIVTGRQSALESLFPDGSFDLATALYERSATMRYVNGLAGAALAAVVAASPADRQLRVLEIGAGTGGTTSALLPRLPASRGRYIYTDVSEAFFGNARTRFAAFPHVQFATLDLERDLGEQGYAPGSVDIVVSSNAVHAVRNLATALRQIATLLAPGGSLILVESTADLALFDITTGLIEGWQHFEDGLRGDSPLLPAERWVDALRAAGMASAGAWPTHTLGATLGQHVVVAMTPGVLSARLDAPDTAIGTAASSQLSSESGTVSIVDQLASALPGDRLAIMRDLVRAEVMRVLRLSADAAPDRLDRLMDLGMDSLMAVQLRNAFTRACGIERLPATLTFDHPTIEALALYLLDRLALSEPAAAAAVEPAETPAVERLDADAVAAMSEDEVEALLLERLKHS